MPPHLQILGDDDLPAAPIEVELVGGTESAIIPLRFANDKDAAFLDTITAEGVRLRLLASFQDGPFVGSGLPVLDERWCRVRLTGVLDYGGDEIADQATGSLPLGTNAEIPLDDIPPQTARRAELQIIVPVGQTLSETRLAFSFVANLASSPLGPMTTLATGSAIVPPDRQDGLRSLVCGFEVTADDTDTVIVASGQLVYEGITVTVLDSEVTLTLADGEAVDLDADENYRVVLSADDAGAITATKGPKNEAILWPDPPADDIFVSYLTVTSPDGVAVEVSQASVLQTKVRYAAFHARAGAGLSILISRGVAVTSDLTQRTSHEISVGLAASVTSRIWLLPDGSWTATLTDVPPQLGGALLCYLVTTGVSTVTEIVDVRRFAHRALTTWPADLSFTEVMSTVGIVDRAAWFVAHDDAEIEEVLGDMDDIDPSWTSGAVKFDIRILPPGTPLGDGTGGVSIFTSSGTDDHRPSFAFDATVLQSRTRDHEVRRIVKGSRILMTALSTIEAPAPEDAREIRARLILRRFR